jgi:serine/threonine-protein kinase
MDPTTRSDSGSKLRSTKVLTSPVSHADARIGRVIGDFRVESPLGQGGMGTVYRGRQLSLDRPVALKFLRAGPGIDPRGIARFEAEARIAASLNHPNVVGVYTLGSCDGLPFIAMELVPGRNLGQILAERQTEGLGPPGVEDCLSIMRQAAAGIQAASELGLVHRDIKPENLILTPRGIVKVADFGLARDLRATSGSLTDTGFTMGTPSYMSPEQVLGRPTDLRSDIYSLGMTFHHLLTGHPPLTADSPYLLGMKQVQEIPPGVREARPDCPEEIDRLIERMVDKKPENRPVNAAEVLDVLSRFDTGRPATELAAGYATRADSAEYTIRHQSGGATEHIADQRLAPFDTELASTVVWDSRPRVLTRRFFGIWAGLTAFGIVAGFGLGRAALRRKNRRRLASIAEWPAALNLADWTRIPRQESSEKQYRYALLWSDEADEIAAWLAVPGYYPDDQDWSWRAYVQLASHLVRIADTVRLVLLRESLARCGKGVAFIHLAEVISAAIDGAEGNEIGMLETLHVHVKEAMDPALAELILTVLTNYRQRAAGDTFGPVRVNRLQAQLLDIIRIDPKIRPVTLPGANVLR